MCSKVVLCLIYSPLADPHIVVAFLRGFDCPEEAFGVQAKTVDAPAPWTEASEIPLDPLVMASS